MTVNIQSAIPLDQEQKKALETVVTKTHTHAEFIYQVDKAVLGGLRVTIGSKRIDLSLAGKLNQIESMIH